MPLPSNCKKIHPNKEKGPCSICKVESQRYIHLCQKIEKYQDFCFFVTSKRNVSLDDCICKRCELLLNRQFYALQNTEDNNPGDIPNKKLCTGTQQEVTDSFTVNQKSCCNIDSCSSINCNDHKTFIQNSEIPNFNLFFHSNLAFVDEEKEIILCHPH